MLADWLQEMQMPLAMPLKTGSTAGWQLTWRLTPSLPLASKAAPVVSPIRRRTDDHGSGPFVWAPI